MRKDWVFFEKEEEVKFSTNPEIPLPLIPKVTIIPSAPSFQLFLHVILTLLIAVLHSSCLIQIPISDYILQK